MNYFINLHGVQKHIEEKNYGPFNEKKRFHETVRQLLDKYGDGRELAESYIERQLNKGAFEFGSSDYTMTVETKEA